MSSQTKRIQKVIDRFETARDKVADLFNAAENVLGPDFDVSNMKTIVDMALDEAQGTMSFAIEELEREAGEDSDEDDDNEWGDDD